MNTQTTKILSTTSCDAWWTMRAADAFTAKPNCPAMLLEQTYDTITHIPTQRTWTILDPITAEVDQKIVITYPCLRAKRVARDLELSWQLYTSQHTDQVLVDKLLENTPIHVMVDGRNMANYGTVWSTLGTYNSIKKRYAYIEGTTFVDTGKNAIKRVL